MSTRRADIEGVRAIAILLVILYHAGVSLVSGGFIGVDVFFALSGYLITGLLLEELRTKGRIDMMAFYARRARRLLPASALTVAVTLAAVWLLLGPLDQRSYTGTALYSALYLSNVWFGLNATDYIAAPPETNPFLHLWSLAVEEQFYLAWPLLVLIIWRVARRRAALGFAVMSLASFALTLALQWSSSPQWAFFASPPRAWEFGVGALGALAIARVPSWATWPGLAAIAIPALAYGPLTRFPGLAALPPVIGTILVLEARHPLVNRALAAAPMQWLGTLSYSWYLWHWPVLVLAKTLWPGMGAGGGLACSGLALVLSALTFHFLEAPVRHARWLIPRPGATLASAVALTAAVLAICFVWRGQVTAGVADGRQVTFLRARDEMPEIYRAGCHLDLDDSTIRDCVYGDPSSATTIILWGDSHAAQWFPAVKAVAERRQWRLVPMTKSGCPAADIPASPSCLVWRRSAIASIRAAAPRLVLLANANVYVEGTDARLVRIAPEDFKAASRRTLQALAGVPTAILLPIPRPGFDVPMCLARVAWRPWLSQCNTLATPAVTKYLEREATRGLPHVSVLDFADAICARAHCPLVVDGEIVYRDDNHLTTRYSARLAPVMAQAITPLVGGGASASGAADP